MGHAPEFISRLLMALHDIHDCLFWHSDLSYFGVNVNDVFYWGCGDLEEITPENIQQFERAITDCEAVCDIGHAYAAELFAARNRKLRPQGASYPGERELWPLFDTCGPERETGFGNPYKPGEYAPSAEVSRTTAAMRHDLAEKVRAAIDNVEAGYFTRINVRASVERVFVEQGVELTTPQKGKVK